MSKFEITPDQAAGVERAAQWHDEQAQIATGITDARITLEVLRHLNRRLAIWHSCVATELRQLVARDCPKSSPPTMAEVMADLDRHGL